MISHSDTVVDPRTVMVEPLHTYIADSAMSGARSSDDFAVRAEVCRVKLEHHVEEINRVTRILSDHAWVHGRSQTERNDHEGPQKRGYESPPPVIQV